MRSWPWKERSPVLVLATPNVFAENEGMPGVVMPFVVVPGVGWLRTLVASTRIWKLRDSLTRKTLLALASRLQFPRDLKFPNPRLPTSPGLPYLSSTSPGVPSELRRAKATRLQID